MKKQYRVTWRVRDTTVLNMPAMIMNFPVLYNTGGNDTSGLGDGLESARPG